MEDKKDTISFYFSNFSDHVSLTKLKAEFKFLGVVEEVFIPNKRNKNDDRFGSVRFSEVKNLAKLVSDLNSL